MNDFIELHDWNSGTPIIIRIKAIDCVRKDYRTYLDTVTTVTVLAIGDKEYEVTESYEKIKNIILGQPMIKWEYNEEDQKLIDNWMESIGCTSFPITADNYKEIKINYDGNSIE